tara:strand:- start:348 stop:590 length:243 start_codon:yes stop_codon:yes gene_type:complete
MKKKSVKIIALSDISKYLDEEIKKSKLKRRYIVYPSNMDTKENRRLNKHLGIKSINQMGNTNGLKKKDLLTLYNNGEYKK